MSYCRCHGRPHSECPAQAMRDAVYQATAPAIRAYTVTVYDLREHREDDHDIDAWTAEDAVTQATLEHCTSRDADGRPLRSVRAVRPRRPW